MQVELPSGNFLKGDFVKEHEIKEFVFIDEPKQVDGKFGPKIEGKVEYANKGKEDPDTISLNLKSSRMLVSKWGSDTKEWMGKKIPIESAPTEKGRAIFVDSKLLEKLD